MKRLVVLLGFAGAMASVVRSQAPAKEIDEAAAQLTRLNASQARMMETSRKMAEIQSALNDKIAGVCNVRSKIVSPDALRAVSELCMMSMNSNQQYLALQTQMQNESRQYTTISNVMKTKHDTAKNSISNVR